MENYLLVHRSILPEYYEKVLAARKALRSGEARDVSQAARMAGISRSTYYKYKDYILEPEELSVGRKAVISVLLSHRTGVLSALLSRVSELGGSILSISQSLPVGDMANATFSLDLGGLTGSAEELLTALRAVPGVRELRLLALE